MFRLRNIVINCSGLVINLMVNKEFRQSISSIFNIDYEP